MAAPIRELVSEAHASSLFVSLQEMYRRRLLTDVALVCGTLEFQAHMAVLAAYSPLFKEMLNKGTFGGFHRHMMTNTSSTCLELLLDFLYSGSLKLTPSIAPLLHAAAQELQIQSAVGLCQQYMMEMKAEPSDGLGLTSSPFDEETDDGNIKKETDQYSSLEEAPGELSHEGEADLTWDPGVAVSLNAAQSGLRRARSSSGKQSLSDPRPKHSCPTCQKKFMHHSSMTLHWKMHTGGIDLRKAKAFRRNFWLKLPKQEQGICGFLCQPCNKIFSLYTVWLRHYAKRHLVGKQCSLCLEKFPCRRLLLLHAFEKHHLKQPVKTKDAILHKCLQCNRRFLHRANCAKHVERAHSRNHRGLNPRQYNCPHCKATYKYQRRFQKHLEQHKAKKKRQEPCEDMRQTNKKVKGRKFQCEECPAVLSSHRDAVSHMKDSHPSTSYPCGQCTWQSPFRKSLLKHIKVRHGEDSWTRTCDICGKVFNKKHHLTGHKFSMHGIQHPSLKLIPCSVGDCNYVTYYRSILAQHMRSHSGAKQYTCEHCHKQFRTQGTLKHHIDILHLNIRPCICELCGASFGSEHELTSHRATHDSSRNFKCSYCSYSAKQKMNLRNHAFLKHNIILDHKTKVLQCEKCGFQTVQRNRFDAHVESHSEHRNIPCKHCDKMFRSRAGLRSHVETTHRPKSLKCDFCEYRTSLNKVLQKHIRVVHTHPHYKPYKCGYCDFLCATSQNCRKHVMQRHKNMEVKWIRIGPTKPQ